VPGFEAIIDQERPIRILKSLLTNGTIPHAFLFTGIGGVGRTTAAIALAMACNCTGGDSRTNAAAPPPPPGAPAQATRVEPCAECPACRKIAAGKHPDVVRIAPDGQSIKIEQARELSRFLGMKPYEAKQRVVIITDAHRMNAAAQNALLKTLEEPPPATVLVLIAPQTADLLPTIVSRCRHIRFKPIARGHLAAILTRAYGLPPEEAALTAALADGSVSRALAMHRSRWLDHRDWLLGELAALPGTPPARLLALAERLARDKEGLADDLDLIGSWLRDLAMVRHDPERVIHQDLRDDIRATAARVDVAFPMRAFGALHEARRRIQVNANPRLTLEALLIQYAGDPRPST
jgi:DNA polymerase-3 subunit delta'